MKNTFFLIYELLQKNISVKDVGRVDKKKDMKLEIENSGTLRLHHVSNYGSPRYDQMWENKKTLTR